MITTKPQPLDHARRILQPAAIQAIRSCRQANYLGWKILDSLALGEPARLLELQAQGVTALLLEILELQKAQTRLLTGPEAVKLRQEGLAAVDMLKSLQSQAPAIYLT